MILCGCIENYDIVFFFYFIRFHSLYVFFFCAMMKNYDILLIASSLWHTQYTHVNTRRKKWKKTCVDLLRNWWTVSCLQILIKIIGIAFLRRKKCGFFFSKQQQQKCCNFIDAYISKDRRIKLTQMYECKCIQFELIVFTKSTKHQ